MTLNFPSVISNGERVNNLQTSKAVKQVEDKRQVSPIAPFLSLE